MVTLAVEDVHVEEDNQRRQATMCEMFAVHCNASAASAFHDFGRASGEADDEDMGGASEASRSDIAVDIAPVAVEAVVAAVAAESVTDPGGRCTEVWSQLAVKVGGHSETVVLDNAASAVLDVAPAAAPAVVDTR